jgi:hypothetical protein
MEKLEIKHLAPYLPYNVNIYGGSMIWDLKGICAEFKGEIYVNMESGSFKNNNASMTDYSLILHPLSDLTKEKLSKYYKQLMDSDLERVIRDTIEYPLNQSYTYTTEFLLKNHYDIYGLIKKGLAININTLK